MKKVFVLLIAVFVSIGFAFAKDTTKVSYYPSRFAENWFIQLGGGINTVFNSGFGPVSPTGELYVGKWFTPSLGLRLGALGGVNRPNGTETGWFSGRDAFVFGHADLDVMWNVLNTFRYNEKRLWDLVPYFRAGAVLTKQSDAPAHVEPALGIGLHNGIRLSKRVDLYVEATAVAARGKAYRERSNITIFPSATAGIVVKLGKVGFTPRRPKYIKGDTQYIEKTDTVTVKETVVETRVDSVLIQKMREEPLTLFFDIDVTILTQRELDHLEFYAKWALTPDSVVLLTGSADKETGNPSHNQWLSEQRNAYVKDILIRVYGLKPENIQEIANGDRKNEFRTSEMNRCVTISFIK